MADVILKVLAEGGSITLYGAGSEAGWVFSLASADLFLDETIAEQSIQPGRVASSWEDALQLLDQYPWSGFSPDAAHSDFLDRIITAVQDRVIDKKDAYNLVGEWEQLRSTPEIFKDTPSGIHSTSTLASTVKLNVVYVLTNVMMPGIVKIGYTAQSDANQRIAQLYTTGVPVPFDLEFACKVVNAEEVERALHVAFGPQRINPKREFFRIDPSQAIAILKLLHTSEATYEVALQPTLLDQESIKAVEAQKAKRPSMNFAEMGIEMGATLVSTDGDATVTVVGPKKVLYDGEEQSLTAVTRQVLGLPYNIQPSPHWTYVGRSLKDLYEATYDTGVL